MNANDLQIVCGRKTFTARRTVVCARSKFFQAALSTSWAVRKALLQLKDDTNLKAGESVWRDPRRLQHDGVQDIPPSSV